MSELALNVAACGSCGTQIAATLLACPGCHALVHRARLATLARDAEQAAAEKDFARASSLWREALALLPENSNQHAAVAAQIDAMTAAIEGKTIEEIRKGPKAGTMWAKVLGPLGVVGLLLWKFKFLFAIIATKGKLLLLGLTKMSTLGSMFVSLGFYWTAWGWKFAAAILGGIYIHEIGHVAELQRRGMSASAPMFIPGLGAFVRLKQHAATPSEDARIGLAGPVWGMAASIAALVAGYALQSKFWFAVAHVTAVINLFNLTPVWQLDGSRGFHALTRQQRIALVVLTLAGFAVARNGFFLLVALVGVWRVFEKRITKTPDWNAFATFAALIAVVAAVVMLST